MDSLLRTRVRYLMECVQGEGNNQIIQSQISNLQEYYPSERDALQGALDCYLASHNPLVCSSENPSSNVSATPPAPAALSPGASSLCRMITVQGEMGLMARQSTTSYQRWVNQQVRPREEYRSQVSLTEREHLEQMVSFYAGQMPPATQELSRSLRAHTELADRFQLYATRPTATQSLHPPLCSNGRDFVLHALIVREVPYAIPVFVPLDFESQWPAYEERLLEGFELLKVFLNPADLERLLHPGEGRNDLSIYIFDQQDPVRFQTAMGQLQRCGQSGDGNRSFYDPLSHRIVLKRGHETLISYEMAAGGRSRMRPYDFSRTFLHEFSHALEAVSLNRDQLDVVEGLRQWTEAQLRQGRSRPLLVPSFLYLRDGNDPHYALRNKQEMFAELATDYMGTELLRLFGGEPENFPDGRARKQLMRSFFSPQGIRPQVLDRLNVERIYREAGLEMTLSPYMPLPFGVEVRGAFSWDPRGNFGGTGQVAFRTRYSNAPNFFIGPGFRCLSGVGCGMELGVGISTPALPFQFDFGVSPSVWLPNASRSDSQFMLGVGARLVIYPTSSSATGFNLFAGGTYYFNFSHTNQSIPALDFGLGYTFH